MSTPRRPSVRVPGSPEITRVPAQAWRRACLDAHAQGGQFGGLFASRRVPGAVQVRALFSTPAGEQLITCEAAERGVDTIVDAIPAAGWDEREAHDLHGIDFAGHEPLRPLLDHQQALEAWTVPTSGQDVHQVAVGPVHAGVIESGHFRFHVVGERILHLDVRLFYKRRGLETAATGRPLEDGIAYAQRMCAACSVANTVAYVHACEAALGCEPDEHVRRGRTILLELERVYNHLNDVSAICAGVGFAPGTMAYAALKERVQRLNHRLTRHRFLFDTVKLGTGSVTLDRDQAAAMRRELATIRHEHDSYWRELRFVTSLQRRLDGVATLSTADAVRLGAVGPVARASGVHRDHRHHSPRLLYHGFAAAVAPTSSGDVAARMNQRALELRQSFDLLDELLCQPAAHGGLQHVRPVSPIGIGRVESPRGETVCVIENDGGRLAALHLRTGSYANWPILAHTVAGELLPDFPLINKSFELCYACADR